jgi:hypothetical protein
VRFSKGADVPRFSPSISAARIGFKLSEIESRAKIVADDRQQTDGLDLVSSVRGLMLLR